MKVTSKPYRCISDKFNANYFGDPGLSRFSINMTDTNYEYFAGFSHIFTLCFLSFIVANIIFIQFFLRLDYFTENRPQSLDETAFDTYIYSENRKWISIVNDMPVRKRQDIIKNSDYHEFVAQNPKTRGVLFEKIFKYKWNKPKQDKNGEIQIRRFPDIICIGAKKCGTGALQYFLNFHPNFKKTPHFAEVHFFDNEKEFSKGFEYYLSKMPHVSSKDFAFEKTPKYMAVSGVAARIRHFIENSDLKIIALVCDPVGRAFSDFNHVLKQKSWNNFAEKEYQADFNKFVKENMPKVTRLLDNPTAIRSVYGSQNPELSILTNGLYSTLLTPWFEHFGENLIIVDGDKLIADPGPEIVQLEDKLGMPKFFREEDFTIDGSNFHCYKGMCPSKTGGNSTRDSTGKSKVPEDVSQVLKKFYEEHNQKFFRLIGRQFQW